MSNEFQKEDRYLVLKWSDMKAAGVTGNDTLEDAIAKVGNYREVNGKIPLETVVVESDWPEYETVWKMIENRESIAKIALLTTEELTLLRAAQLILQENCWDITAEKLERLIEKINGNYD